MYTVVHTKFFEKSFKKIKDARLKESFGKALDILEKDPFNKSNKYNIKKLVNLKPGEWRIRVGDYRIRYDIKAKEVVLHMVRHRKDIYK